MFVCVCVRVCCICSGSGRLSVIVWPFGCLCVGLFVCLFAFLCVRVLVCLLVRLSMCAFACVCVRVLLFVCAWLCLCVCDCAFVRLAFFMVWLNLRAVRYVVYL